MSTDNVSIRILSARLINGKHVPAGEFASVPKDLARYLCASGVAESASPKAPAAKKAA